MYELVRESTRKVVEQAEFIRWHPEKLVDFAARLDPEAIRRRYTYEDDFHLLENARDPERQLDYVFTVDAINFGSGYSPMWKARFPRQQSLYMTVASGLKRYMEAGGKLDAAFAAGATTQTLGEIFQIEADFPLIQMFAQSLNQLGSWVINNYSGSYVNLINSLEGQNRAARFVQVLSANLGYFNDMTEYRGEKIYFFKRAQILANDLYLAFEGKGYGYFPDVNHLTMFADNLLPHVFRVEGILEYDPLLLARIEQGVIIESGSPEEVELRAFGVQCVEELTKILGGNLFPAQVDVFLWNLGQNQHYKQHPRHLTQSFFY